LFSSTAAIIAYEAHFRLFVLNKTATKQF